MSEEQAKPAKKQVSEQDIDNMAKDTGALLGEQPKVTVKLFLNPEEKRSLEAKIAAGQNVKWPAEEVIVNGYKYVIHKGKEVEVPQTVKEILEEAGLI